MKGTTADLFRKKTVAKLDSGGGMEKSEDLKGTLEKDGQASVTTVYRK